MRVHKFAFDGTVYQANASPLRPAVVRYPLGGQILTGGVDEFSGKPCLWILVDAEEKEMDGVAVIVAPTGVEVPDEFNYLSTFKTNGGSLVWHIFIRE